METSYNVVLLDEKGCYAECIDGEYESEKDCNLFIESQRRKCPEYWEGGYYLGIQKLVRTIV